jgi:hypothetical protein
MTMPIKPISLFALLVVALLASVPGTATQDPNGCALTFEGEARARVKNRRPGQRGYFMVNGGRALDVPGWFSLVCALDEEAPARRRDVPKTVAMASEKQQVKVRAFILAVSREEDNDLHVQIGETDQWDQPQVVVEIPPGRNFCDARTVVSDLMRADGWNGRRREWIFRDPPRADITGYVFLDADHLPARSRRTDWCVQNGNRGMKNGRTTSPVRGLWELHPVFRVELVP